ncbi:hypothetical protein F5Y13DRAFT_141053 [Hypoxylon sp. FL1857]|nr:hypothetical protein F5Y13DRAFT_141053 [Hypoxylon sp. FL1857]
MVGFVGRLRKPKLAVALGSPHQDDTLLSQRPTTPRQFSPPVLRNFSYPFNLSNPKPPPPFPSELRAGQTAWDQLGEICRFSPDGTSRTGQTRLFGLDNPFLFKSETENYTILDDSESETFDVGIASEQLIDRESPSPEEPKARKRQRRSTLLGLPSSQAQSASRL